MEPAADRPSRGSLFIPILRSDESVEVRLDELPSDAIDLLEILRAEYAALPLWLRFALEYLKQGKTEQFKQILQEGTSPEIDEIEVYRDKKGDRIALLNTLAAFYTQLGRQEKDKTRRDEYFEQATSHYNKAVRIDPSAESTLVGKGALYFALGDSDRALKAFTAALDVKPDNTPALLGKAMIMWNQDKPQQALESVSTISLILLSPSLYRHALETNPLCPPAVRLGIGLCHARLGNAALARKAFERVLQLEENNVEALLNLALLQLNTAKKDGIAQALMLLKRAYELVPQHPRVQTMLANHLFYKRDYTKADLLARTAFQTTDVALIKGESLFLLARSYHERAEYDSALTHYEAAIRWAPELYLANYGLAQLYILKGENEKAIAALEKVQAHAPEDPDVLKILGSLYLTGSDLARRAKAKDMLRHACDVQPKDFASWVELAQLLEATEPEKSLQAYEKVARLMENLRAKGEGDVPAELYNNIGALRHLLYKRLQEAGASETELAKRFEEARDAYQRALTTGSGLPLVTTRNARHINEAHGSASVSFIRYVLEELSYNIARLLEDRSLYKEAEALYKDILKEHPTYVDCVFRLGAISRAMGKLREAGDWYLEAMGSNPDDLTAWTLIGCLHLEKEEWGVAQKKFERILQKIDGHDYYSLLALGNVFFAGQFDKKDKTEKYLKLAYEFYGKVLSRDPKNIFAVNGIGCVLVQKGYPNEAKDFFTKAREALEFSDVALNLAHIFLTQKHYTAAIKLYESTSRKFFAHREPTVLTYLARAYFEAGRLQEAKTTLMRAMHLKPTNQATQYNLALTHMQAASLVLKKTAPSSVDLRSAVSDLNHAVKWFTYLGENKTVPRPYSASAATFCLTRSKKLLGTTESALTTSIEREAVAATQAAKSKQETLAILEQEVFIKQEKEREIVEQRAREEEMAREEAAKVDELKKKWSLNTQKDDTKKKGKRGKRAPQAKAENLSDNEGEDSALDNESADDEFDSKKKEKAREEEEGGAAEEEEEEAEAELSEESSEAPAGDVEAAAAKKKRKEERKKKKKNKDKEKEKEKGKEKNKRGDKEKESRKKAKTKTSSDAPADSASATAASTAASEGGNDKDRENWQKLRDKRGGEMFARLAASKKQREDEKKRKRPDMPADNLPDELGDDDDAAETRKAAEPVRRPRVLEDDDDNDDDLAVPAKPAAAEEKDPFAVAADD